MLAGGSAFGLAAADGVMRYLAERGQGFATAGGPVPIVPAACIFDLVEAARLSARGRRRVPRRGRRGARAARWSRTSQAASVRAPGATVGKWRGRDGAVPGGVGVAAVTVDGARVGALAVVNALGDVVDADGTLLAGSTAAADVPAFPTPQPFEEPRANTTLVVVVTDAALDKTACFLLAQSAHDGFALALRPAHTRYDGDIAFAVATATIGATIGGIIGGTDGEAIAVEAEPSLDRLRLAATDAVGVGDTSVGARPLACACSTQGVP